MDHAGDQGLARRVAVDVANEPDVELHDGGPQLGDVPQTGEPGTGIVDCDARRRRPAMACPGRSAPVCRRGRPPQQEPLAESDPEAHQRPPLGL